MVRLRVLQQWFRGFSLLFRFSCFQARVVRFTFLRQLVAASVGDFSEASLEIQRL